MNRAKVVFSVLALLVGTCGGAYATGRFDGSKGAKEQTDAELAAVGGERDAARVAAEQTHREAELLRQEFETVSRRAEELEARRVLGQAHRELDRRNFGLAQLKLIEAADLLEALGGDFVTVSVSVRDLNLHATEDVASQAEVLETIIDQMDSLL